MKSLAAYIQEGILDDDTKVINKTEQSLAPYIILSKLREVFGQLDNDREYDGDSYLGSLNSKILKEFNSKSDPIAELKSTIMQLKKEINKIDKFKANVKMTLDSKSRLNSYLCYDIIIEYKGSESRCYFGIGFSISYDRYIKYVNVLSVDSELIELENQSNILKDK